MRFSICARVPGLKKRPSTSELLDWLKLLMAEDIGPELLRERNAAQADPAFARRAAEKRAGRASVRAPGFSAPARPELNVHRIILSGALRAAGVKASLREYLTLQEAMQAGLGDYDIDTFYFLARATLVKDERLYRQIRPRVRLRVFKGYPAAQRRWPDGGIEVQELPEEWLRLMAEKTLTEKKKLRSRPWAGSRN